MQNLKRSPFQKGRIIRDDGGVKIGIINSGVLDSTCWSVQFRGIEVCKSCGLLGTSVCGGSKEVREDLRVEFFRMRT